MKRAVSFLIILTAMTVAVHAQFFVEGSVRAGYNTGQSLFYTVFDTPSNIFFNASSLIGYQLNYKTAVGVKASLVRAKEKITRIDPDTGDEVKLERRAPGWSLSVFCRYQLLGSKKVHFLVECSTYISENKIKDSSISASVYKPYESASTIGINLLPLVTYDLSDKFSFIATGDFLSLDFSSQTTKYRDSVLSADKRRHFGFTGKSTLFGYLPDIRIGFIYHFNKSNQ